MKNKKGQAQFISPVVSFVVSFVMKMLMYIANPIMMGLFVVGWLIAVFMGSAFWGAFTAVMLLLITLAGGVTRKIPLWRAVPVFFIALFMGLDPFGWELTPKLVGLLQ